MGVARVLIADNDSTTCLKYQESLQRSGFEVEYLDSGKEVLKRLKTYYPQIFLLSDSLPEVNIFEFCRLVKSGRLIPSIPILLLSSRRMEELSKLWPDLESHIDSLLVKPFTGEDVVEKVRSLLGWQTIASDMEPAAGSRSMASHKDADNIASDILEKTQHDLEEKALIIAQLKSKLKGMEKKLEKSSRGELTRDDYLKAKVVDLELEMATKNLCLAEMEVKVEELILLKTDFEKRAQDIIEQKVLDESELRKKYEELLKMRESLQLDNASLKKEMEEAVVGKEQKEELLEAREQSWQKEKEELEGRLSALLEESVGQEDISRLERQLGEKDEELAGIRKRCLELEEESARLRKLEESLGEKDEELAGIRKRCRELEEEISSREKDLGSGQDEHRKKEAHLQDRIRQLNEENEKLALALQKREPESEGISDETGELLERIAGLEEERDHYRKLEGEAREREEHLSRELEEARSSTAGEDGGSPRWFEGREELNARLAELENSLEKALKEKEGLVIALESMSIRADEEAKKQKGISSRLDDEIAAREELESRYREISARIEDREAAVRGQQDEVARLAEVLERKERDLAAEKNARKTMEEEFQLQLINEREEKDELRKKVQAQEETHSAPPAPGVNHINELRDSLMDAVKVAQREILEKSRVEADMVSRLESLKREKEDTARRSEDERVKARERERRLEELLDRALSVSGGQSSTFLPATITSITTPSGKRMRRLMALALTGALLAVIIIAYFLISRVITDSRDAVRESGVRNRADYSSLEVPAVKTSPSIDDLRGVWRKWTRKTVSGGVILQATLRSPEELRTSIEAEAETEGWKSGELEKELQRQIEYYDFDRYYYMYIYIKNLESGYPLYADNLQRHVVLRDESGKETAGQIPEGMAEGKVIYSHAPSMLAKEGSELMYEVAAWVVFPKLALSPDPALLQLIAYDIGATSRRVLTWEMIGSGE